MTAPRHTVLLLTAGLLSIAASEPVTTCDALRSQIEARIRAAGVTQFLVTAVDADAVVPGQVVGTCDRGRKKIVYLQITNRGAQGQEAGMQARAAVVPAKPAASAPSGLPAPSAPPARPAPAKSAGEPLLTECADGTVQRGGDCRK